jgi:hypothetical protein
MSLPYFQDDDSVYEDSIESNFLADGSQLLSSTIPYPISFSLLASKLLFRLSIGCASSIPTRTQFRTNWNALISLAILQSLPKLFGIVVNMFYKYRHLSSYNAGSLETMQDI